MKMTILDRDDGISHVVLIGHLDTTGVEEIDESFSAATAARDQPAIIDLSEIDFMASRGIGMLFGSSKRLKKSGHKLVLLNPQELVESALVTSRMDTVMPIAHGMDEAIRILQGAPGQTGTTDEPRATAKVVPRPQRSAPASTADVAIDRELTLAIKNEISELERLNAAVAEFLAAHEVPHRATYAINLAIDELVVNVIRYAYVDDDTHTIDVALAVEGDQVVLRIVDDGRQFDPRSGPTLDLHAEDREVGGLGLILVLDMVDVLKYERIDEQNRVEVRVHRYADEENGDLTEATQPADQTSDE